MNKLKPLVWKDLDEDPMLAPVSVSESPLHHYVILKDGDKFMVRYSERFNDFDYATGFDSLEAGKEWAWKHYKEKMSFYFEPESKWINVKDTLPKENGTYAVAFSSRGNNLDVDEFNTNTGQWEYYNKEDMVKPKYWMKLPKPPSKGGNDE